MIHIHTKLIEKKRDESGEFMGVNRRYETLKKILSDVREPLNLKLLIPAKLLYLYTYTIYVSHMIMWICLENKQSYVM